MTDRSSRRSEKARSRDRVFPERAILHNFPWKCSNCTATSAYIRAEERAASRERERLERVVGQRDPSARQIRVSSRAFRHLRLDNTRGKYARDTASSRVQNTKYLLPLPPPRQNAQNSRRRDGFMAFQATSSSSSSSCRRFRVSAVSAVACVKLRYGVEIPRTIDRDDRTAIYADKGAKL